MATTKRKAQTKPTSAPASKKKAQEQERAEHEAAVEFFSTWHPFLYSLCLWAALWVGTGMFRVLSMIFGTPDPLPRVTFGWAVLLSALFGFVSTALYGRRQADKVRKAELRRSQARRVTLAEMGLPDPGEDVLREDTEKETERIAKVQQAFDTVCRTASLQALRPGDEEKSIPPLLNVRSTVDLDITADLVTAGGNGITIDDIKTAHRRFAEVAGAKQVRVRRKPTPGHATITFLFSDPLDRVLQIQDLPLPKTRGNVVLGIDDHGQPVEVLPDRAALLAAYTGAGKSNIEWCWLISKLHQGEKVQVLAVNPKEQELRMFRDLPRNEWLNDSLMVLDYAEGDDAEGHAEGLRVINRAVEVMQERKKRYADLGVTNAREEVPNSFEEPYVYFMMDEGGDYLVEEQKGSLHPWGSLKQKCRAANIGVLTCVLSASESIMKEGRKLYATRICLRAEAGTGVALFGADATARGADPARISPKTPGVGFIVDPETGEIIRFRSPLISDADKARAAEGLLPEGMGTGLPEGEDERDCAVYWLRDVAGESVYIGKAFDPEDRIEQHKKDKPWIGEVDWVRGYKVFWRDNEEQALTLERLMILKFKPYYNTQHNLDNPARIDWKRDGYTPREIGLPREFLEAEQREASVRRWLKMPQFNRSGKVRPQTEEATPFEPLTAEPVHVHTEELSEDEQLLANLRASRRSRVAA